MTVFIEMLTIHFGFTQCACISVDFINPTYPYLPVSPPPPPLFFFLSFFSLSKAPSCVFVVGYKYCTSIYDLLILNAIQGHVWWRQTQRLCIISVPAAPFTFTSTVTCFEFLSMRGPSATQWLLYSKTYPYVTKAKLVYKDWIIGISNRIIYQCIYPIGL